MVVDSDDLGDARDWSTDTCSWILSLGSNNIPAVLSYAKNLPYLEEAGRADW